MFGVLCVAVLVARSNENVVGSIPTGGSPRALRMWATWRGAQPPKRGFHRWMLRLTLDTNCVIAAAQDDGRRQLIDQLVELVQAGSVALWLTSAFVYDQTTVSAEARAANFGWLAGRPCIGEIPGPF